MTQADTQRTHRATGISLLVASAHSALEGEVPEEDGVADVKVVVLLVVPDRHVTRQERDAAGRGQCVLGADRGVGIVVFPVAVRRTGPGRRGMNRRIAVAEPELQLVIRAAQIEELRAVDPVLLLRTERVERRKVVVPDRRRVAPPRGSRLTGAAVGMQAEAARDLRPHAGHVEARADDMRGFALVDSGWDRLPPGRLPATAPREG